MALSSGWESYFLPRRSPSALLSKMPFSADFAFLWVTFHSCISESRGVFDMPPHVPRPLQKVGLGQITWYVFPGWKT